MAEIADTTPIKAKVYKQFTLAWEEFGKSALIAGIIAFLTLIYVSFAADRFPTSTEWLKAAKVGITAIIGVLIRYFINPTNTVIKGQNAPVINTTSDNKVIVTETNPK